MSIFGRASFIIIAISAPALAMGNPEIYHPSYYPLHNPYKQDSPPDRNDYLTGAKLGVVEYNRPTTTTPTQAGPAYAPPAYGPPAAYEPPAYYPPGVPMKSVSRPPAVSPDHAYDTKAGASAYVPPDTQAYKSPADAPTYKRPAEDKTYRPPADIPTYKPPAKTSTESPPNTSTTKTSTETYSPPKWGHGKPSPLPNGMDRRNAPRVPRQKIGSVARGARGAGHTRRPPFLKKRQQAGQHAVIPVTVNMITGIGHSASTSSTPTPTNALPPGQSPFAPGVKVDTTQAALSLQSNPEATMPSVGEFAPPVSPNSGSQQFTDLDTGEPRNKAAVIASILSVVIGLVVVVTVVKLTRNAMRKRKHAAGLRRYNEHLSSKEGLIPEMSEQAHFETHDVIITDPDGSEISPLSSSCGDSPSPPLFGARGVGYGPSPLPMPTFAPPPTPASPLSLSFVKLLSPTVNLAQQNAMQSRASATSETMSLSTTSTDIFERRSASDSECLARQVSHRRMRSAPGSVAWSTRSSGATGKLTSGLSGEEGYWESVDVCGSESVGGMVCRSSRGRSVAMSVMW